MREPALDAHLYFGTARESLLTVDLDGLITSGMIDRTVGGSGLLRARRAGDVVAVGEQGNLTAAWFWHAGLAAPPTEPSRLRDALTRSQQETYDRVKRGLSRRRPGVLLVLWDDAGTVNALGVQIERTSLGQFRLAPLEVARTDASVLRLRSGPDAPCLAAVEVAVFGVGAIGSEIAMLLARSGVGRMVLVDRELLRPSNLSRHSASGRYVGKRKTEAMAATIREALPDVRVDTVDGLLWRPDGIAAIAADVALLVDATGNRAFTDMLSRIAALADVPLVAASLHRGGRIARIRVQATADQPLWNRSPANGFPDVPADPGIAPVLTWETGCGAPVNNAPPVAVAAAGALATRVILDALSDRDRRDRDVFEVYEPIEDPRFATPGLLTFTPST